MKNLRPLGGDHEDRLNTIIAAKHNPRRNRLESLFARVCKRYAEYDQEKLELFALKDGQFSDEERADLLDCYDTGVDDVDKLIVEIRALQDTSFGAICQYCAISARDETDHYLPKTKFQEFSVLPINLIPSCGQCNGIKGVKWKNTSHRTVINLYYDPLPTEQYLFADLNLAANPPFASFWLDVSNVASTGMQNILRSHFEIFDLIARYNEMSNSVVTRTIDSGRANSTLGRNVVSFMMSNDVRNLRRQFGDNYWQAAIIEAAIASPQFWQTCGM